MSNPAFDVRKAKQLLEALNRVLEESDLLDSVSASQLIVRRDGIHDDIQRSDMAALQFLRMVNGFDVKTMDRAELGACLRAAVAGKGDGDV